MAFFSQIFCGNKKFHTTNVRSTSKENLPPGKIANLGSGLKPPKGMTQRENSPKNKGKNLN